MPLSVPTSAEQNLVAIHTPHQSSNFSRLVWILNPFPPSPQPIPACRPNNNPLLSTIPPINDNTTSYSSPTKISKHPAQNPLPASQLIIGSCSLTAVCKPPVHWPKIRVSSHPVFSKLLMTMPCKTVSKTLLKSEHVTTNAFFLPTRSVALSQKEKRLVSDYLLLTNPCWLFCSYPRYLRGVYDRLFDCLFHVLAGSWLDYKSLDSAFSPCYR